MPRNAHFWQVGLLDIVFSEYPDKSHNFRNFIFMTSHLSTLWEILLMFRKKLHASGGKLPAISAITFNQEGYIQLEISNTQGSFNIHEFYFFHRMSMARHPKRAVNILRCYRSSAISDAHCLFWV